MADPASRRRSSSAQSAILLRPLPLPCGKNAAVEIDKRFVEYLLKLSDGVTGRTIIEVLRRTAFQAIADKSQKVGISSNMQSPHARSGRLKVVIFPLGHP